METQDNFGLPEFQAFLENIGTIPDKHIPYYLRWVSQLLARHDFTPGDVTKEGLKSFLAELSANASEWQIKQASDSIDLYFTQFLKITPHDRALEWDDVLTDCFETFETLGYAPNTVKSYTKWCRKFSEFIYPLKPHRANNSCFKDFLTHLALERKVAPQTQNQAVKAVSMMYRDILNIELDERLCAIRAKTPKTLPNIIPLDDIRKLVSEMHGQTLLMVKLIYSSGLTLAECISLRIGDIDFKEEAIHIRKGAARDTLLPEPLKEVLNTHINELVEKHRRDLALDVSVSYTPERTDDPFDRDMQWLFPSDKIIFNRTAGRLCRKHIYRTALQKAIKKAAGKAGLPSSLITPRNLRNSFAVAMLDKVHIRELQELLGHKDVRNTMVYEKLVAPGGYAGMWNPSEDLD